MTFFSSLGKIILSLVIIGIIIGGISMYYLSGIVQTNYDKLVTLDEINYELERNGEQKISMNILDGGLARE